MSDLKLLLNGLWQKDIEKAQEYSPFEEYKDLEHLCKLAPIEFKNIKLSCSS